MQREFAEKKYPMADKKQKVRSKEQSQPRIHFKLRNMAVGLELIAIFYALVSLGAMLLKYLGVDEEAFGWINIVNIDMELTLPTTYSVMLLFITALILALISCLKFREKDNYRWHWLFLSVGFLVMTLDEGSSIHELVTMPMRSWLGDGLPGFLLFAWIVPALLVVLVLAFIYLRFFLALPRRTRKWLLISAGIYLLGALGMEMVGGQYADIYGIKNLTYNILVTIEETLEMTGIILGINTFLDYLEEQYSGLKLTFK
jgi:uncharacterized Tic20 family protein